MTKQEVAKQLRKELTRAIRSLPDDVDYKNVSLFEDFTTQRERDVDCGISGADRTAGAIHVIEFNIEEVRDEPEGEEGGAE